MTPQESQPALVADVTRLEFNSIKNIAVNSDASTIYYVGGEALPYAFFLKQPVIGKPLVIFGQGDQNRKTVTLPRFQRMDWARMLDYNVLIFSDPTLHLSPDTGLGWMLGTKDHYVLEHIREVIEKNSRSFGTGQPKPSFLWLFCWRIHILDAGKSLRRCVGAC